jgi:surface antigen
VEAKLLSFIAQYLGKPNVGDNAANKGQCVGLIEVWLDAWKLPHIWGNGAELMANADLRLYTVIGNRPSNAPPPGAVLCWDRSWGGGFGHTAVVVAASSMQVVVFEQNDPLGAAPVVSTHSYNGVEGWVVPKSWPA